MPSLLDTLSSDYLGGAAADLVRPPATPARCEPAVCEPLGDGCHTVFRRVGVSLYRQGRSRVFWSLQPGAALPTPVTARLEASEYGGPWEPAGTPAAGTYELVDPAPRDHGVRARLRYRVTLTAGGIDYTSDAVGLEGTLAQRDWLIYRETRRQELQRFRHGAVAGLLIKRAQDGEPCDVCVDPMTGEPVLPDCPSCYGTGLRCGYLEPQGCTWAMLSPASLKIEPRGETGGTVTTGIRGTFLDPQVVDEDDIWVNARTDERFYVDDIQHLVEWRGVPILADVTLRQAAGSSTAYRLPPLALAEALVGCVVDPPVIDPPIIDPPAADPPANDPPADDPPADDPPADDPPADDPPADDPPADDPPADDPPADDPPADDPPADDPPADDPPADDPPATGLPTLAEQPTSTTVGLSDPGILAVHNGGLKVTTAGAVIENLEIRGTLNIQASNVTVRNVRVIDDNYFAVKCYNTNGHVQGVLFDHVEVVTNMASVGLPDGTRRGNAAIYGAGFRLQNSHIHDCLQDAVSVRGSAGYVEIEHNLIERLGQMSGAHADGVQFQSGGNNSIIRLNVIDVRRLTDGTSRGNSALIAKTDKGPIDGVILERNWIEGGNFTIYSRSGGNGDPTNVVIRDNWVGPDFKYGILSRDGDVTWSGNYWTDLQTPVPIGHRQGDPR